MFLCCCMVLLFFSFFFFFQAEDGIRDGHVTGVQTCALPIFTETSEHVVTVVPSSDSDEERAEAAAEQYVVPAVLADGEPLPSAPEGASATPTGATGARLEEGALTLETEEPADATVTVEIAREDAPETTVAKTFEVTVLPQDASTDLAAYHRTPTSEQEANNADVAYSMHLALAEEDGWQPLNERSAIFIPRISQEVAETGSVMDLIHSLRDRAVFALPEGGYGIV